MTTYTTAGSSKATYGTVSHPRAAFYYAVQQEEATHQAWQDAKLHSDDDLVVAMRFDAWLKATKAHTNAADALYEYLADTYVS
jgi:hypothetical protein